MGSKNDLTLEEKTIELESLLEEINDLYEPVDDEFLNEMFFSGIYRAKEFCNTLKYVLGKKRENDSV